MSEKIVPKKEIQTFSTIKIIHRWEKNKDLDTLWVRFDEVKDLIEGKLCVLK